MGREWASGRAKKARQDQAGLETTAQDVVACRMVARPLAQSEEVAMRTRREGAVQDQTWVTSNPRARQGSRGTQSRLDRGATQRKSPSPVSSSQWPALISLLLLCLSVVRPSARFLLSRSLSLCVSLSDSLPSFGGLVWPPLDPPPPLLPLGPSRRSTSLVV